MSLIILDSDFEYYYRFELTSNDLNSYNLTFTISII